MFSEAIVHPHAPFASRRATVLAVAAQDYDPGIVRVDRHQIAQMRPAGPVTLIEPDLPPHVAACPDLAIQYLLLLGSLNYRFWDLSADGSLVRYRHQGLSGSQAMRAAFAGAWGERGLTGRDLSPDWLATHFGDLPDSDSRLAILQELLAEDGNGAAVDQAVTEITADLFVTRGLDTGTAARLAQRFPQAYGDPYLKKAQLALAEIGAYLRSILGPGETLGIDLTVMADYQVPRVLRALGILHYTASLAEAVDTYQPIAPDSREERAIRAATILACEELARHLEKPAAYVDYYLWSRREEAGETPFHLTLTTAY